MHFFLESQLQKWFVRTLPSFWDHRNCDPLHKYKLVTAAFSSHLENTFLAAGDGITRHLQERVMTSPTISRGECISKGILHVHFFLRATTSKTLKGDTHISDVVILHVTNLRLVTAFYHKRHR